MLVIRDAQIQSFIASNDEEVALLVAQAQIRMNPARVDGIRPARLRSMAKIAVEKARLFGLEKAEDISGFASLMFEISPLFYEQEEIKAALTDTAYPIDIRLHTLFQRTDDAAWTQAVDRYEPGIWFGEGPAESAASEEGNEPPPKDHIELTLLQVQKLEKMAAEFKISPSPEMATQMEIEVERLCHYQNSAKGAPKARAEQAFEQARSLLLGRAVTQPLPRLS